MEVRSFDGLGIAIVSSIWLTDSASTKSFNSEPREPPCCVSTRDDRDDPEDLDTLFLCTSVVRGNKNEKRLPWPKFESTRS